MKLLTKEFYKFVEKFNWKFRTNFCEMATENICEFSKLMK